jgi:hypothetical protein
MKLLGDWNWYLPHWLEWLPRLEPEHGEPDRRVEAPTAPAVPTGEPETTPQRARCTTGRARCAR